MFLIMKLKRYKVGDIVWLDDPNYANYIGPAKIVESWGVIYRIKIPLETTLITNKGKKYEKQICFWVENFKLRDV